MYSQTGPSYWNPGLLPAAQPVFDGNSNTEPYAATRNSIVPVFNTDDPQPNTHPSGTFGHALFFDGACDVFRLVS